MTKLDGKLEKLEVEFIPFRFEKEHERYVEEMYRLWKDQERKVFDMTVDKTDLLGFMKTCLEKPNNYHWAAIDKATDKVCAIISLEDVVYYNDYILETELHCIFARHSWGKKAREVARQYFLYLDNNLKPIKRLVASVPQHNFGVIKYLKDLDFKLEGTLRAKLIYPGKDGTPKFYNQLVYTKINEEITPDGKTIGSSTLSV